MRCTSRARNEVTINARACTLCMEKKEYVLDAVLGAATVLTSCSVLEMEVMLRVIAEG